MAGHRCACVQANDAQLRTPEGSPGFRGSLAMEFASAFDPNSFWLCHRPNDDVETILIQGHESPV